MDIKKDFILEPRKIYDFRPKENIIYDTIIVNAGIASLAKKN